MENGKYAFYTVEKSDKSSGKKMQKIMIQYDLVYFIPINELLQKGQQRETACQKSNRFRKRSFDFLMTSRLTREFSIQISSGRPSFGCPDEIIYLFFLSIMAAMTSDISPKMPPKPTPVSGLSSSV